MTQWTIEAPTSLDFDDVSGLRVRLIAGSVAVLATDGKPSLDVADISGEPLNVTYEDGLLTISHENLTWEGLLKWLRPHRHSATVTVTVPRKCQTQVGVVSAAAVMSGIRESIGQERLRRDHAGWSDGRRRRQHRLRGA